MTCTNIQQRKNIIVTHSKSVFKYFKSMFLVICLNSLNLTFCIKQLINKVSYSFTHQKFTQTKLFCTCFATRITKKNGGTSTPCTPGQTRLCNIIIIWPFKKYKITKLVWNCNNDQWSQMNFYTAECEKSECHQWLTIKASS